MVTKIRLIKPNEINETAKVFLAAFNGADVGEKWTAESAADYLTYWYQRKKDLFFIALNNNKIAGGVVGDIVPFYDGRYFDDGELFVDPNHQENGIGKALTKKVISQAIKKYNIIGVSWLANFKSEFPMSWYKKLGLKKTRWILMEGDAKKVLNSLE